MKKKVVISNSVDDITPCQFPDLGESDGWKAVDFDGSGCDASAELMWEADMETNNMILCRVMVDA